MQSALGLLIPNFAPTCVDHNRKATQKSFWSLEFFLGFSWGSFMSNGENGTRSYEFGSFRLDVAERRLLCGNQTIPLPPKVFDTLTLLVENNNRLVTKEELMSKLWPDTFVEEVTVARNISDLRKALGEASGGGRYIETVPKHGYRFAASVIPLVEESPAKHNGSQVTDHETIQQPVEYSEQKPLTPSGRHPLLRSGLMIGIPVMLAAAVFYFAISRTPRAPSPIRSIAVLPFKYIGGEESDRYIEVGMADALITKLSRISRITVRPTNAITRYSRSDQEALAAGRELAVDSVLDGHIQRSGDRVRVSVQLISVSDGSTLWADTFDSKWTDMFTTQDSISERTIRALTLKLTSEEEKHLAKRYTENAEAHQAYMKGRYWWNKRSRDGFNRAIEFFNEAISLDRNYALAYAGLADCYAIMSPNGIAGPKESYPKAKAAATQALALDDQLCEAHVSLANIIYLYDWDFAAAESEFKRAIDLDPNYPTAHHWYSVYLSSMGHHDEAIAEARLANELDPTSLPIILDLSRAYYHARRYDEAIAAYQKAFELNPQYYLLNSWLELSYAQKGLYDQAIEARFKALSLLPVAPEDIASRKDAYAKSGWRGYWQKELELSLAKIERGYLFSYQMAKICVRLGQTDQAMKWLEEAYEERLDHLVLLKVDPLFDPLRSDPRFTDLLRRIGFGS
jgi:TolB-like protein/DNA-binding winged helix-turn-helix (wHTH) protein/tetratricopeptide (TPR) repeat protein